MDAKFGNPNPINLFEPRAGAAKGDVAGVSYPEEHNQREVEQRGSERNPSRKSGTPTGSHGRQHACAEKDDDEPRENHVNRITPIKTTAPAPIGSSVPSQAAGLGSTQSIVGRLIAIARLP